MRSTAGPGRQPSRSSACTLSHSVHAPRLSVNKHSSKYDWKAKQEPESVQACRAHLTELRTVVWGI